MSEVEEKKVVSENLPQSFEPEERKIKIKAWSGKMKAIVDSGNYDDGNALMKKLTGTQDEILAKGIIDRGMAGLPDNRSEEMKMNQVCQSLADFEPRDAFESRLCLQANALYDQGMQCLSRAEKQDWMCHAEYHMKFAIKLLRLHNETIEALDRYRRGGEQKILIKHVNINDGGRAAFMAGNFKAEGGGEKLKNVGLTS